MTNTKRWLDELPLGSGERELLLVGKAARPAEGAIDANWQALCATLGTTAISGTFATSAAASSSAAPAAASASAAASAKVGASIAVGKAASAGLFVVAAKSLALGVGIGLAVMGAATVVQHSNRSSVVPATATKPIPAQPARRPLLSAPPIPAAAPPIATEAAPVVSPSGVSAVLRAREPGVVSNPMPIQPAAAQPAVAPFAASTEERTASLARQARELAELKRLIDHGSPAEALGRLDKNFSAGTPSVLSEERDALYVQALARAQRRDEARTFARQFLLRYPHSPYFETMRQLLTEE
ncbi:MAG TPA: hypothetical protein VER96_39840 [Polyangiaceae bacterium]|nr:hypothetical protein [Polyangiaceae bacterium]